MKSDHSYWSRKEFQWIALVLGVAFTFLALVSFRCGEPEKNLFGLIGYGVASCFHFLMGLTSYPFLGFLSWFGYLYIRDQHLDRWKSRFIIVGIFLSSFSMLLTWVSYHLLDSQNVIEYGTYFQKTSQGTISYIGGVPSYFFYVGFGKFGFHHLLSPFGSFLFFFSLFAMTSVIITDVSFFELGQKMHAAGLFTLNWLKNKLGDRFGVLSRFEAWLESRKRRIPSSTYVYQEPSAPVPLSSRVVSEYIDKVEPVRQEDVAPVTPPVKKRSEVPSSLLNAFSPSPSSSRDYRLPQESLLHAGEKVDNSVFKKDVKLQSDRLEETLRSFGIEAKVVEICQGPRITSFEVLPSAGVKVQKIKTLENDIALNLKAKAIRIVAPIPGKAAVGIEIPNPYAEEVSFRELLASYHQQKKKHTIPMLLGKAVNGDVVTCDLVKMPHCIIAGATGSGKSVCLNTVIVSILMTMSPDEVRLLMVDPKKVELTPYNDLPHMISPVITEPQDACLALNWLVKEMESRYELLKLLGHRNILSFNQRVINQELESSLGIPVPQKLPFYVGIIDELADLMMVASSDIETPIARIAQMARAVGIHLIIATQRPSREVITGLIKANFPARIAFKVASRVNSQIILDEIGAESLLGNGDMLFLAPGNANAMRAQGAFIRDEDINKIVESICRQAPPNYLIRSFAKLEQTQRSHEDSGQVKDQLFDEAKQIVLSTGTASTTFLQRKLKVGYARAASLMDLLEEEGVVGPQEGSKPRKVFTAQDSD